MVNQDMLKIADNFFAKGNFLRAEKIYLKLVEQEPENVNILVKLARIYIYQNNYKKANTFLKVALELGHDLEVLKLLAYVKFYLFEYYDAIVMYEQIIELEPSEEYYENLQILYSKVELPEKEAEISLKRVEKYHSEASYRYLFHSYLSIGRIEDLNDLKETLIKKYSNKGFTYDLLGLYEEIINENLEKAEELYKKAIKLGMISSSYNLAVCYRKDHKYLEAEKACRKILKKYEYKQALYYTYASIFFTEKKMNKGYKYYLQRTKDEIYKFLDSNKAWDGKDYKDKTLLVVSEQGYGDCIMFARYLYFLRDKFKLIKFAVPKNIVDLFSINYEQVKNSNIEIISNSDIYDTTYDKYVLMMNLPYYLQINFYNIPFPEGYMDCYGLKYNYFKEKYFQNNKIKIGLCWRAKGEGIRVALQRTIDINYYLQDLFDIDGVEYYSIQKEDIFNAKDKFPQIIDLSEDLDNFEDTAAAIKNMDLVISIDSAPAHLAGALGVQTFLLLPFCPEWRWFQNDKKTEWYSSVEIFKQKQGQNWSSAAIPLIERVKEIVSEKRKIDD